MGITCIMLLSCNNDKNNKVPSKKYNTTQKIDKNNLTKKTDRNKNNSILNQITQVEKSKELKLKQMTIKSLKIISKRSWSLKIYSSDGSKAVFKPFLKNNTTARHEVAYYILATLLNVKQTPVSTIRTFSAPKINTLLHKKYNTNAENFAKNSLLNSNHTITGAIIEWMDNIEPLNQNKTTDLTALSLLLKNSTSKIAQNASKMIALDFLLGNWDRFSGGNLFRIKNSNTLALIDQNNSFSSLSKKQKAKITSYLKLIKYIPVEFINAVNSLNASIISSAVKPYNHPNALLTKKEILDVIDRKNKLVPILKKQNHSHSAKK